MHGSTPSPKTLGAFFCLAALTGCVDSKEASDSDNDGVTTGNPSASTTATTPGVTGSTTVTNTATTTMPSATASTTTTTTATATGSMPTNSSTASATTSAPTTPTDVMPTGSETTPSTEPDMSAAPTASGTGGAGGDDMPGGTGGDDQGVAGSADQSTAGSGSNEEDASAAVVCPDEPALSGGQEYCSNSKGTAAGGYGYELWAEGSGSGCMTVFGNGAAFKANWDGVEDFLARVGLDFDETRTHQEIGTISADFAETQTGSEDGLTYIGMYGWTVNPLREYYILDDWGATKPAGLASDGTPRDEVGTIVVDGETYDVWKKTRENKPSIKGTTTFDQYFSIRRKARACGHISVSEHFTKWEELGLQLGDLYEVKLLVESQNNSGAVEFSSAAVRVE